MVGDEARIRQILLNLLGNAVKYTNRGYIFLSVTGSWDEVDSITVSFTVSDTGIGLKKEDIDKLFSVFVQFDTHKNREIEGTGLGLAISRNLCRMMGGDITVQSVYEEGSVFAAVIPQKVTDPKQLLAGVTDPAGKSVIIYDERPVYGANILSSLENLGVKSLPVVNQEACIRALETGTYRYLFASPFCMTQAREAVRQLGLNTELILLADLGQFRENIRTLSMPAYSVPISNVLNDVPEENESREKADPGIRFVAPDARILVVDDINTNLRVVKGLIAPYEIQVDCCSSGVESIEMVQKNQYDIVFMDHMMPGMDGIETTAAIRSLGDAFLRLPIIALTANVVSGVREMFIESRMNDYLAKPIDVLKLNEILERWIPREKRLREIRAHSSGKSETPLNIPGMDTAKGLEMVGGSETVYREVLDLYCKDVRNRLDIVGKMPDAESLAAFTTHVHALKSASASIGASAIAEEARALEVAGKECHFEAIRARIDGFTAELSKLVERIRRTLEPEQPGESMSRQRVDPGELDKLKSALEARNIREIDRIVEELGKLPLNPKAREAFSAISDHVLLSEFDEAIALLADFAE
jgi:CheY-like chemotaxis protein/HPt (histidine-containing phosphotransfer) domain-containing protein